MYQKNEGRQKIKESTERSIIGRLPKMKEGTRQDGNFCGAQMQNLWKIISVNGTWSLIPGQEGPLRCSKAKKGKVGEAKWRLEKSSSPIWNSRSWKDSLASEGSRWGEKRQITLGEGQTGGEITMLIQNLDYGKPLQYVSEGCKKREMERRRGWMKKVKKSDPGLVVYQLAANEAAEYETFIAREGPARETLRWGKAGGETKKRLIATRSQRRKGSKEKRNSSRSQKESNERRFCRTGTRRSLPK